MTVSSNTRKSGPFAGNNSATSFTFDFKAFSASDVLAVRTDADGVEHVLTYGVDYSVVLNADQNSNPGGTLTYPVSGSPLPTGETLTPYREMAYLQALSLPAQGPWSPTVVEAALDRAVMLVQQVEEAVARALLAPISDEEAPGPLPARTVRTSRFLAFDANGEPIAAEGSGTPVSGFMARVNESETAAGALSVLGVSDFAQELIGDVTAGAAKGTLRVQAAGLTALRALAPVSGERVYLGYHTAEGDGGNGWFRGVTEAAAGTYTDNGGTTIVPTGGDGSAAWLRDYSGGVNVRWFGVHPDNAGAINTPRIQAAFNTGEYCVFPPGFYAQNAGLSYTGAGVYMMGGAELRPSGAGYTAVTIEQHSKSGPHRVVVRGTNNAVNGIYLNGPAQSEFDYLCGIDLDGFGVEIHECWDCTFKDIFTENCGTASAYAFSLTRSTDTCNTSYFERIQVELSKGKAISINNLTLNCSFGVIHSERTTPDAAADAWILGGDRCVYNSVRLNATGVTGDAKAFVDGSRVVFNAFAAEDSIPVTVKGLGGGSITFIEPAIAGVLAEDAGQIGNILLVGGIVTSVTLSDRIKALGTSINGVVHGPHVQTVPAVAASGTVVDFTGIPATAKKITVLLNGISTNGTSLPVVQLGDIGGVETTGYLGSYASTVDAEVSALGAETGFPLRIGSAMALIHGKIELTHLGTSNVWVANGMFSQSDSGRVVFVAGSKNLSGTLDRVRLTTNGGVDAFDAGTVCVQYEM